jgi:CO/xanthine dehydrogenase Mo-binding subunit
MIVLAEGISYGNSLKNPEKPFAMTISSMMRTYRGPGVWESGPKVTSLSRAQHLYWYPGYVAHIVHIPKNIVTFA